MVFKKGEKHTHTKGENSIHLATLDEDTRLYASSTAFTLKKLSGEVWSAEYFYTSIPGAIAGYIKHQLRNKKIMKTRGSLDKLIQVIQSLDNSVKSLAKNLEAKFRKDVPMFDSLCSGGPEDEEETDKEQEDESPF